MIISEVSTSRENSDGLSANTQEQGHTQCSCTVFISALEKVENEKKDERPKATMHKDETETGGQC